MNLIEVNNKAELFNFYSVVNEIYSQNPFYRSSEDDILRLIVEGPTHFHTHTHVLPMLIVNDGKISGRFAFISDQRLSEYIQVAFFEAKSHLENVAENIIAEAKKRFPDCKKICFGLNGHLNYGAGILLNNFDKVPVFGLPYTMSYYKEYFKYLDIRKIVSFKFPVYISSAYKKLATRIPIDKNITIKKLDRKDMSKYTLIYTQLNNTCFQKHPFWSDRDGIEDHELFEPFRHLLRDENLLFAEYNGKPVGFLLWFPDFNQLLKKNRELKANGPYSYDVLRYKFFNPINTFRFTEIAVDPEFRKKGVEMALINQMIKDVLNAGYKYGEGGFIFEENLDSVNMAIKYIERIIGKKIKSDSEYAVFEADL